MQYLMNGIKALCHGRGPSIRDVCIDTTGVFLGILIVLAIVSIFIALKKDDKTKKSEKNMVNI